MGGRRRGLGVRLGPQDDEDSIAAIHHALDLVLQDPLPAGPAGQQVGADEGVNASPFGPKDRHDPERASVLRPCAGACLAALGLAACGGRLLSLDPRHPGSLREGHTFTREELAGGLGISERPGKSACYENHVRAPRPGAAARAAEDSVG